MFAFYYIYYYIKGFEFFKTCVVIGCIQGWHLCSHVLMLIKYGVDFFAATFDIYYVGFGLGFFYNHLLTLVM